MEIAHPFHFLNCLSLIVCFRCRADAKLHDDTVSVPSMPAWRWPGTEQ